MLEKILCVDDEPNILQAYQRSLRKDFQIDTADGGEQALALMASAGPYAVIVSDMRMPGMDGVQFLTSARALAPETVRIMLTGNADQKTAASPNGGTGPRTAADNQHFFLQGALVPVGPGHRPPLGDAWS